MDDFEKLKQEVALQVAAMPWWERVRLKVGLFYVDKIYWRAATYLWRWFGYDLYDRKWRREYEQEQADVNKE